MNEAKWSRLIGMVLFATCMLLFAWYWQVGQWALTDIEHSWYAGQDTLIGLLIGIVGEKRSLRTDFWYCSQLTVPVMAWSLRTHLGRLVNWVYGRI